ncbi:MAG: hypothetical protein Mars2KO_07580 [Maribacter sp.]
MSFEHMKIHLKLIVLFFFILWTARHVIAQEVTPAHRDSLEVIVTKYYDLNLKIFQTNSTIKDIDEIFDLFTDDFTYVHPKYGGIYTREDLYKGYVRNQKNGGYTGKIADIKIENKIIGLNAIVVEKRFVEKKDGVIEDGKAEMTLFEFRDGKISRIFEYW